MGVLSSERLNEILSRSSNLDYNAFLETGTYNGRSVIPLAKNFPKIEFHTIEIVEELFVFAKKKANKEGILNLNFYLGDTTKILGQLLKEIKSNNIIVFLDAHSSGYEGYSAETMDQDQKKNILNTLKTFFFKKKISTDIKVNKLTDLEVPLLKELNIISNI